MNIENFNAYLKLLVNGIPAKPFNIRVPRSEAGDREQAELLKNLSIAKYGGDRAEIEKEILKKYERKPDINLDEIRGV